MRRLRFVRASAAVVLVLSAGAWAAFQSAVITLQYPLSARECAMGEAGTALADDEAVAYFNPAGLGAHNMRWRGGAGTWGQERLLPAFGWSDLFHLYPSLVYQLPPSMGWKGIAADFNYISFGENETTDINGQVTDRFYSWEAVAGIAAGYSLGRLGLENHSIGAGVKYVISALAPGSDGTGVGQTFAVDLGYLYRLGRMLSIGVTLKNFGPPIFYVSSADADPLPFTPRIGVMYRPMRLAHHELLMVCDVYREIAGKQYGTPVRSAWDGIHYDLKRDEGESRGRHLTDEFRETRLSTGMEYWCYNIGTARMGFLYDWIGERYELTYGFGVNLFNHVSFDWSSIYSPEGFMAPFMRAFTDDRTDSHREGSHGVRHGQTRVSVSLTRVVKWSPQSRTWFLEPRR